MIEGQRDRGEYMHVVISQDRLGGRSVTSVVGVSTLDPQ